MRAWRVPIAVVKTASTEPSRHLRPGMRQRSKAAVVGERAGAWCACRARTCSRPPVSLSHSGCASRASRRGSSATSQAPAVYRCAVAPKSAALPGHAVAGMAAQVLPGQRGTVQVQRVEVGGASAPGRGGHIGIGRRRHGACSVQWNGHAAMDRTGAGGFSSDGGSRSALQTRGARPALRTA